MGRLRACRRSSSGDRAVFVRLMSRPGGDAALARRTIDGVLALFDAPPDLNEFKHTSLSALTSQGRAARRCRSTAAPGQERASSPSRAKPRSRSSASPTIGATKSVAPASASGAMDAATASSSPTKPMSAAAAAPSLSSIAL